MSAGPTSSKRVLVIGGTRFSGLYLVHELNRRGHVVTMFNRGSKSVDDPSLMIPGERDSDFAARASNTRLIKGDRKDEQGIVGRLGDEAFDWVFDMGGREAEDTKGLAEWSKEKNVEGFVYMSSAGVYKKSDVMPHIEGDEVDEACRHKGKLETEEMLRRLDVPWTAIRPTYIYGAGNYNALEQWFFERLEQGRPICIPGHGTHLTGLGHVKDLARAMASVIGNANASKQVYNIQDRRAVTFDGFARICARVMGKAKPEIIHYDPKEYNFGKKKAFPFRPQHFFCSPNKALRELDWKIEYDLEKGLSDFYENDFLVKKATGKLKNEFETDEIILSKIPSLVS